MKKRRIKLLSVVILLLLIPSAVIFAGGKKEQPAEEVTKEISFWHHEAPAHRVAAFQKVIDLFQKEYPSVKVKQEVVMWGDAWVKSLSSMEAGTLPDFQFAIPDLTLTMYKAGALAPVTDLVKEIDAKYKLFPNQKNMYFYQGEYWGLPIFTMVMLLTYRPSFLQEYVGTSNPPKTWEECLDYARKITEKSGGEVYGIGIGGAKNLMTDEQAYIFLASTGARFFDEKGNVIFNNPKTIEALKLYKELIKYAPPGAEAWSWGEIELNIAAGTLAMSPYFPSVQKRFHEEFDSGDYAAAHIPFFKDRKERGTITYPNEIQMYKKTLENREKAEAVKNFIRFMMQPEINAILTSGQEPGGFFPTTEAAANAKEYWENAIVKRFESIHKVAMEALKDYATLYGFEYGKWVNIGIGDITGADVLAEVVNKIVSNQMTVENAVAWGQKEMEKYSVLAK
ncbi:MAG: sugar ABC transporter substrate-binding protein [Spirochaetota bacterium]